MGYDTIKIRRSGATLHVTISNGDINLLNWKFMSDFDDLMNLVIRDPSIKVVILDSANKEFFLAHIDLLPRKASTLPQMHPDYPQLGYFHGMIRKWLSLPAVTIAVVEGFARGGGADVALACDMQFGLSGHTVIQYCEIQVGLITASLPALVQRLGKSRAMEVLLAAEDFDAELAEKYGLINRAFATKAQLNDHVGRLSRRISKFHDYVIRTIKDRNLSLVSPVEDIEQSFQDMNTMLRRQETLNSLEKAYVIAHDGTYCQEELDLSNALMKIYE